MSILLLCVALLGQAEERAAILEVSKSVVALRHKSGHGSGFIIDSKGWILTNAHVACSPLPYVVELRVVREGRIELVTFRKALLAGVHPERDLALVKIDPSEHGVKLPAVRLAAGAPAVEQGVHAIGFPSDIAGGRMKVRSDGKVLSNARQVYRRPYIESDVSIAPGNSGGPLCTGNGEVVGVVTLLDPDSGSCYSVPAWEVNTGAFVPLRQRGPDPAASVELINEANKCLRIANERRDLDFLEFAAHFYERASFWDPGNDEILLQVAAFHMMRNDPTTAAAHLARSLTLNPWPAKGSIVYAALAASLFELRRPADVDAVAQEGLLKYPDRCGLLLEILAAEHFKAGRWVEAALFSRRALRHGAKKPEDMNRVHKDARARFTPEQERDFRERETQSEPIEAAQRAEAEAARRQGKTALTPAFQKFMETFDGIQREGGGIPGRGGASVAADADRFTNDEVNRLFGLAQHRVALEHFRNGRFAEAEELFAEVVKLLGAAPEADDARRYLKVLRERKTK